MYLISTVNFEMCGFTVFASGTKADCLEAEATMFDGSDIYAETYRINAKIVTNARAARIFGGQKALMNHLDHMAYQDSFNEID